MYDGYIVFKLNEPTRIYLRRDLGILPKELGRLMFAYVAAGGEIDETPETRPEWSDWEFHWDLRFSINGTPIYVETLLHYASPVVPDDSLIEVVNIHAQ